MRKMMTPTSADAPRSSPPGFLASRVPEYQQRIEGVLARALDIEGGATPRLLEAMRYSTLAGGKRVRPVLVYATGEALGAPLERLDAAAAAVELIHVYSLVHDDLPAMDDDDLRRGRATCHRAFDEATAILTGDALQARAFEVLAQAPSSISADARIEMLRVLADGNAVNVKVLAVRRDSGQLLDRQKKLEREIESFRAKAAAGATADLASSALEIAGVKIVAARVEGLDAKALRDAVDTLKGKLPNAVILLASAEAGKAALVAGVQGSALGRVKAGELLSHVANQIGGKGGGRPDMAQGGGDDGPALIAALAGVSDWVAQRLQ